MLFYLTRNFATRIDKNVSKQENISIILTTVFTTWISPVTVWSNTHKNHSLLLLSTGITNIISMYVIVATVKSLRPEIMRHYLLFYNWENHFENAYVYLSIIAAIALCCSVVLQILGNPHNIHKVSKILCCFKLPIVGRGMIYDFLEDPHEFSPG